MRTLARLAVLLLAAPVPAQKTTEQADSNSQLCQALNQTIAKRLSAGEQALLVAIVKDGKVLFASSRGKAGRKSAATDDSLYPLGGMTRFLSNLVVAELAAQKQLRPSAIANRHLGNRRIRDREGRPVGVSLREVMRGEARLPQHRNFLPRQRLHEWPLQRALREHAIVMGQTAVGSDLDYAVVQEVVQTITSRPWADAVQRLVFKPAGVEHAVADARFGLPKTAVVPMQKGLFGIAFPEKNYFSNFVAANGAWANSADLARLLVFLTRNRQSTEQARDDIAFASFRKARSLADRRPFLELHHGMPGMRGSLRVYPEHRVAWIVLSNFARGDSGAQLNPIHLAIERRVLPEAKANAEAQGMGGNFLFNSNSGQRVDAEFHGRWIGKVRLRGRDHEIGFEVTGRGFVHADSGGGKKARITGSRASMTAPNLRFDNLLPVRRKLRMRSTLSLKRDEEATESTFQGLLTIDHRYCHMEWWVRIRQQRR